MLIPSVFLVPLYLVFFFLETGSVIEHGAHCLSYTEHLTGDRNPQLFHPSARIIGVCLSFHVCTGDLKSIPHACVANTTN